MTNLQQLYLIGQIQTSQTGQLYNDTSLYGECSLGFVFSLYLPSKCEFTLYSVLYL